MDKQLYFCNVFLDPGFQKAKMSWGRHQGIVAVIVVFAVEIVVVEVSADIAVAVIVVTASAVVEAVLDAVELDTSEDVTAVALIVAVDCDDMVDAADVDSVDTFADKVSLNISINHWNCFSCNLTLNYLWIKSERKQTWNLFCLIDQRSQ